VFSVSWSKDGSRIVSTDAGGQRLVWEASTGKRLNDAPVPLLAAPSARSPDGKHLAIPSSNDVLVVGLQLDDEERLRRLWLMRHDPQWHVQKRLEFEKEKNAYAAALHSPSSSVPAASWPSKTAISMGRSPTSSPPLPCCRSRHRHRPSRPANDG
jgi:WD40 repeat protein